MTGLGLGANVAHCRPDAHGYWATGTAGSKGASQGKPPPALSRVPPLTRLGCSVLLLHSALGHAAKPREALRPAPQVLGLRELWAPRSRSRRSTPNRKGSQLRPWGERFTDTPDPGAGTGTGRAGRGAGARGGGGTAGPRAGLPPRSAPAPARLTQAVGGPGRRDSGPGPRGAGPRRGRGDGGHVCTQAPRGVRAVSPTARPRRLRGPASR